MKLFTDDYTGVRIVAAHKVYNMWNPGEVLMVVHGTILNVKP